MAEKAFEAPAIPTNYGQLWLALQSRAWRAQIDHSQARTVHNRWKRLGKLAAAGRLK